LTLAVIRIRDTRRIVFNKTPAIPSHHFLEVREWLDLIFAYGDEARFSHCTVFAKPTGNGREADEKDKFIAMPREDAEWSIKFVHFPSQPEIIVQVDRKYYHNQQ
jgi:hypothetical protein